MENYSPTTVIKACDCKKGKKTCCQPTANQISTMSPSLLKGIMKKNKSLYVNK